MNESYELEHFTPQPEVSLIKYNLIFGQIYQLSLNIDIKRC